MYDKADTVGRCEPLQLINSFGPDGIEWEEVVVLKMLLVKIRVKSYGEMGSKIIELYRDYNSWGTSF